MSRLVFPLTISFLFALVYGEATALRSAAIATAVFMVVIALWLTSFVLPPLLFRYSSELAAPVVLSQLMKRATVAAACLVAASVFTLIITGLWLDLPFVEEMYGFTLIGMVIFHGFGGPFAHHVVYLQQTHQYHSTQVAAVLIAFTLILLILALFFLNLDFAFPRDAHVQFRDLVLLTTVLIGYASTIYSVTHH